ncbi:metal dependent phosphohydrolase [Gottschalkia acidurici 9a]|uniref:Metal dependent phosphohydrolase n=1 Tax=Gottschalkia acidurici (strain ATCC 7906 / DSM 604 / BCRC 14475 / CIP 104303 / KCTC 5404 / NCIMB 10678 / 9a) TaxID=1128398 RepID=K0AYG9_GOTA9|nr:HDIG domain-containing metalloprotein [Gottschalkia acidurici]AFS78823.1 metal dependent phosphohydrolase [Gottschalkia acidurici 9a]
MPSLFKEKISKIKKTSIYNSLHEEKVKRLTLLIMFTVLLFVIVVESIAPEKIIVKVGDIAQEDIRATKDIIDEELTEKLKQEAISRVELRHRVDTSVQVKIKDDIRQFFNIIKDFEKNDLTLEEKEKILLNQNYVKLSKGDYNTILKQSPQTILLLENNIYETINQVMGIGIKAEEIDYEKSNIAKTFQNFVNLPEDAKKVGANIVNNSVKPNRFLDMETTQQKREEAAEQVEPVVIKEGQIIVGRSQIVDQKAYDLIKKTGLLKEEDGVDYSVMLGALIIVILLETIIVGYLYIFDRKVFYNTNLLTILSIIILSVVIISKITSGISGYLMPISIATMLISILINPKFAIVVNVILSIVIGTTTSSELSIIIMSLLGGIGGAFASVNTQQRYNIILTGLIVSGINVLTIIAFGLVYNFEINELLHRVIYGFTNGIFSSILAIGSLPLWESIFGILTPLKLLELSNPNQPLLKRLLLEAPGTYHHSVLVGNLSEAAAEEVGANPLLTRVGAYYHDVGKIKRPYFFKENQISGENPHDKINPNLSALILTNHTKDGVALAKSYKIPQEITDIIKEHHGTTLVAFFYHKALNGEDSKQLLEERFRYEGPKPQTKEAAIVMLADSVEAAVRSMREPNKGKIEGLVRNIIKGKLNDGQLDECALTLKDLDNIATSFMNVLMGIYHQRIEYPNLDLNELKGGN